VAFERCTSTPLLDAQEDAAGYDGESSCGFAAQVLVGTQCNYNCKPGYAPVDGTGPAPEYYECVTGGVWQRTSSTAPLQCVPSRCDTMPVFSAAFIGSGLAAGGSASCEDVGLNAPAGTECTGVCDYGQGYVPDPASDVSEQQFVCVGGQWMLNSSMPQLTCKRKCPTGPPLSARGYTGEAEGALPACDEENINRLEGDRCHVSCAGGYVPTPGDQPNAADEFICMDGSWVLDSTAPPLNCTATCPAAPTASFTWASGLSLSEGSCSTVGPNSQSLKCDAQCAGSAVPQPSSDAPHFQCINAQWQAAAPIVTCVSKCINPPLLPAGFDGTAAAGATCSAVSFAAPGATCTAVCAAGLRSADGVVTSQTYRCGNGQWALDGPSLSCVPQCPASPSGAVLSNNHVLVPGGSCPSSVEGAHCAVQCASGFANGGALLALECGSNGQWSLISTADPCVPRCSDPPAFGRGVNDTTSTCSADAPVGSSCSAMCATGFAGNGQAFSCSGGVWQQTQLDCVKTTCDPVSPGSVIPSYVTYGSGGATGDCASAMAVPAVQGQMCAAECIGASTPQFERYTCTDGEWVSYSATGTTQCTMGMCLRPPAYATLASWHVSLTNFDGTPTPCAGIHYASSGSAPCSAACEHGYHQSLDGFPPRLQCASASWMLEPEDFSSSQCKPDCPLSQLASLSGAEGWNVSGCQANSLSCTVTECAPGYKKTYTSDPSGTLTCSIGSWSVSESSSMVCMPDCPPLVLPASRPHLQLSAGSADCLSSTLPWDTTCTLQCTSPFGSATADSGSAPKQETWVCGDTAPGEWGFSAVASDHGQPLNCQLCSSDSAGFRGTLNADMQSCTCAPSSFVQYTPGNCEETCFTDEAIAEVLMTPRIRQQLLDEERRAALDNSDTAAERLAAIRAALLAPYELTLPNRQVDVAALLYCAESPASGSCTLQLVSLALKFVRAGDFLLSLDEQGGLQLEPVQFLAHSIDRRTAVELVVLEYERADGSVGQLKLTPDHLLHVRSSAEGGLVAGAETDGQPFAYETQGAADFRGERGGLSFAHLVEAGRLRVGDQLWHQPLRKAALGGSTASSPIAPLQSVRIVRLERRTELVVVQVPEVRSMRPLLDGLAASTMVTHVLQVAERVQPLLAPLVWLRGERVGEEVTELMKNVYRLLLEHSPVDDPTSPQHAAVLIHALSFLPLVMKTLAALLVAVALAAASRVVNAMGRRTVDTHVKGKTA